MTKRPNTLVQDFASSHANGALAHSDQLGQRGAFLSELTVLGLPVPPGFVITTAGTLEITKGRPSEALQKAIEIALSDLEKATGQIFGSAQNPLFVSVRASNAAGVSGMLEAVLNIGFNETTAAAFAKSTSDPRLAYECYRRLIQNYAHVVLGDDPAAFEDIMSSYRDERSLVSDSELSTSDALELVDRFRSQVESTGEPFPKDANSQLYGAIAALVKAWSAPRAKTQRKLHGMAADSGLAITVHAMVFGNRDAKSGAGFAVSHRPDTGEAIVSGEFMREAQGPDMLAKLKRTLTMQDFAEAFPDCSSQLKNALNFASTHFREAIEFGFTLEQAKLWLLDAKPAKLTTASSVKLAVDMANAGTITRNDAILRIDPLALGQMLHTTIDPAAKREVIGSGLPASPGAATGRIVFDAEEARIRTNEGDRVILVRPETLPEDIRALHIAEGVLTTRGGMTSHAAVIARGMGKPCVAGASALRIDVAEGTLTTPGMVLRSGDIITIDGTTGQVMPGHVETLKPTVSGDFATLLTWADDVRRMKVRANAETPHEARIARDFGADGIGLCRTEHMFFEDDRIIAMQEMILADHERDRRKALAKLLPMLKADFVTLFEIMAGKPVTLRLLDPPLHEFLPEGGAELEAVANSLGTTAIVLRKRVTELSEQNPMLGHRGVRLLISYPEITDMQARAIFEAAAEVTTRLGKAPVAEIMVPLVVSREELDLVRARITAVASDVERETGIKLTYLVGTMIELPRAALKAADIAKSADFFSFGTNDLTQTAFGISRDDSARFIGEYTSKGIFTRDPFISLDIEGVGELIEFAVQRGRSVRPKLNMGICGEHGGDPDSIAFCEQLDLDYVSCSPFRVPIARLAGARATLLNMSKK